MPVLLKLNEARKQFHASAIRKTGRNTFSNYDYFELADFLVPALKIFDELKLSAVVSFGKELASMTLTDLEDGTQFLITSPMSTASLKACHEVQNLGAVQTYIRRYLWVAALEIVEHDAVDSSPGPSGSSKVKPSKILPTDGAGDGLTKAQKQECEDVAVDIVALHQEGRDIDASRLYYAVEDNDMKVFIWKLLASESALRAIIKANSPHQKATA